MAELRHEYLDDRWTLYAPERADRPLPPPPPPGPPPPAFDPACPFCPGNEALAGAILYEAPPVAGAAAGAAPWAARSVDNKYPILRPEEPSSATAGTGARGLRGAHEVIVETPRHDHDLTAMDPAELCAAVAVYRDRQRALEERWGWATLFRNRSGQAGASLVHPHAQIVAAEEAPPPIRAREARAAAYLAQHGRTYLTDAIARARGTGEGGAGRVVLDRGDGFVAFVPHAAEVPFELWLAPERPEPSLAALGDGAELDAFADALGLLLRGLVRCTGAASYNFVIVSASRAAPRDAAGRWGWHWYLRLRPRLGQPGGFEVATGVAVNPSLPERDAPRLREAVDGAAP